MIYLIFAKDSKQRLVEINDKNSYKTNLFYNYLVENFVHKNILYPIEFYNQITKQIFPHRVNIIYTTQSSRKLPNIFNAIVLNNKREIIKSYKNDIDDVYIFATSSWIIEEFSDVADYIIVFASDSIGYTTQSMSDFLNFSNYDLIRNEQNLDKKYHIEYYVSNKKRK